MSPEDSIDLARTLARLADSKLGEDITLLDMRDLVAYTDFLVVCGARNERQAEAIAEEVQVRLKRDRGLLPVNAGFVGDADWKVLDYLDCVLHIFTDEARQRYDLEDLWHEAPRLELDLPATPAGEVNAA
ncbi:MAG: ribosome silencing factor [Solirubrobacterales bacterium]|nr:ribosome silencing factor [Solirubrobacterales bacterium]